jgi:hypothetical protein
MSNDSETRSGSASGIIFRKSTSPMDVLDASRSRPDVFSKLYCGYSTPAHSGTCCRKATTNRFIVASKPGAAMKFPNMALVTCLMIKEDERAVLRAVPH